MEETRLEPEGSVANPETGSGHGEDLVSAFATPEIPPDVSDTPQLEMHTDHAEGAMVEHSESSTSSSRRQSETEGYLRDTVEEDGPTGTKSSSSRSSLSSIPHSVLVHPKEQSVYGRDSIGEVYEERGEYMPYGSPVYQKIRDRNSPFRHPSSVKAIQMQTEDEEDEDIMSSSRRKAMFRGSPASVQSLGSPLLRRHGYHSAGGTPKKSPIKRENPLVLLHCTILQPTVILAPGLSLPDRQILEKVLPPQYWRRWKLLEEKIIASGLLRDRGLLIQHPQEDYGLLEERLLESLELQRPRLDNGHFNNLETSDSESEDTSEKPKHPEQGGKGACVDCGCHVNHRDDRRKWDVKFYAANGLMKEGAWTAAWKEIERVDVQVSLWLPYEVKSEVEKRIKEENLVAAEKEEVKVTEPIVNQSQPTRQTRITQDEIDGLDDGLNDRRKSPQTHEAQTSERDIPAFGHARPRKSIQDPDLHTLIINSLRVIVSDRRNIITAVSMLIAVLAVVFGGRPTRRTHYGSDVTQFGDFPAVSTQVYYTSSTSVLTQVSTEVPVYKSESGMESYGEVQRVVEKVEEAVPAMDPVVLLVEPQHDETPIGEAHEHKTIETPQVESQIEIIETAKADVVESTPSTDPSELIDELPKATATAQDNGSATTQDHESSITRIERPAIAHDDNLATSLHLEDDESATTEDISPNNDFAASQGDESSITRIEHPAIAYDDDLATSLHLEDHESATTQDICPHNDFAASQDDKCSINMIENIATIENNDPVTAQEDGPTTAEVDINEAT